MSAAVGKVRNLTVSAGRTVGLSFRKRGAFDVEGDLTAPQARDLADLLERAAAQVEQRDDDRHAAGDGAR